MAFQPVPQVVQVTVKHVGVGQLANSEAQWSMYCHFPAEPSQGGVDTLCDAVVAWVSSDYDAILSEDWRVNEVSAKSLHEEGAPFKVETIDVAGALTGDPAPPNCAMYFKFLGNSGSKPLRGGVFWPVGSEASLDGNNWLSTFRTTASGVMDSLIAIIDGIVAGATHRIISRYESTNDDVKDARQALRDAIAATRRAEGVSNEVNNYALRAQIASQRDRRGD